MSREPTLQELFELEAPGRYDGVSLNYRQGVAKPAGEKAQAFADALMTMIGAKLQYETARALIPDYTGQWSPEDYYQTELELYNRSVDALWATVSGEAAEAALTALEIKP
jgi:hypothetical protein